MFTHLYPLLLNSVHYLLITSHLPLTFMHPPLTCTNASNAFLAICTFTTIQCSSNLTEINCGPPHQLTNSTTLVNGTTFGDTANYTCEVGFKYLSGAGHVVTQCHGTGNWTYVNETCTGQHACSYIDLTRYNKIAT